MSKNVKTCITCCAELCTDFIPNASNNCGEISNLFKIPLLAGLKYCVFKCCWLQGHPRPLIIFYWLKKHLCLAQIPENPCNIANHITIAVRYFSKIIQSYC